MSETRQFLNALFAAKPNDHYVYIWTIPEKISHWFQDVDDAAVFCENLPAGRDVFYGVGLAHKSYGPHGRCPSVEVSGMVAFICDADLLSEAHPEPTLPPTIEAAMSFMPREMEPSMIVRTGNGFHAYWIFKEAWMFESAEERQRAMALHLRWHTHIQTLARQKGYSYKRLADLARVLRVAGTQNWKDPLNPKPAEITSLTEHRYNPSDFEELLDLYSVPCQVEQATVEQRWAEKFKGESVAVNLDAVVPQATLDACMEADQRFKKTWLKQRTDLNDSSPSGYDLALADFGIENDLKPQQIVDLIVHHRRLHHEEPRRRLDYFKRTLSKAAHGNKESPAPAVPPAEAIPPAAIPDAQPAPEAKPIDPEYRRSQVLGIISERLGVLISKIVKLSGKEPIYILYVDGTPVEFTAAKLMKWPSVREAIFKVIDKPIDIKPKQWADLLKILPEAYIVQDAGQEMEFVGAAEMLLDAYLARNKWMDPNDMRTMDNKEAPALVDGHIVVSQTDILSYASTRSRMPVSMQSIVAQLDVVGARVTRIKAGPLRDRRRWKLPIDKFPPENYGKRAEIPGRGDGEADGLPGPM